jgi:glycosyltransferase involved in cell wall biosynthesis
LQTQVITHLNFAKGFRGGERQTQLLIEQLALNGYTQKLLVRKGSELTPRLQHLQNLTIIEISKPYIFSLKQIKGSTLLHAHETKALQFAYFAKKVFKIPYIVTRRVDNKIKNNFLNKALYHESKYCVALSKIIQKEIIAIAPDAHTTIIPSAFTPATVDAQKLQEIKARFHHKFLVGHVGALDDKHKGQSFLIEAAKQLQKSHPDIHFIFIGGGADEMMLKQKAKGLNNITFEGFVNNVHDYISALDLFVFPSRNEGLGSILFDVMQLNVPIIASDVGGIPDIIQNELNGVLTPPFDSDAITKQILRLYKDKGLRENFVRNAQININKYSVSNMTESYSKLYQVC